VVTLPLITGFAIAWFDRQDDVSMPLVEIVKVFALILLPVGIGMLVNHHAPGFARRMDKAVRIGSAVILAILVLGILLDQLENVGDYLADVGLITALFCAISLVVGYVVPKAFGVTGPQAIASSMEVGVHNATLAIFVAVEVLDEVEISVPAAVYSLVMFLFAALWGTWVSKRVGARDDAAAVS
jgi:BASS family bile acid:Na+ symporter